MDKKKRRKYKPEDFTGKKADCPQSGTATIGEGYCTDSGTVTKNNGSYSTEGITGSAEGYCPNPGTATENTGEKTVIPEYDASSVSGFSVSDDVQDGITEEINEGKKQRQQRYATELRKSANTGEPGNGSGTEELRKNGIHKTENDRNTVDAREYDTSPASEFSVSGDVENGVSEEASESKKQRQKRYANEFRNTENSAEKGSTGVTEPAHGEGASGTSIAGKKPGGGRKIGNGSFVKDSDAFAGGRSEFVSDFTEGKPSDAELKKIQQKKANQRRYAGRVREQLKTQPEDGYQKDVASYKNEFETISEEEAGNLTTKSSRELERNRIRRRQAAQFQSGNATEGRRTGRFPKTKEYSIRDEVDPVTGESRRVLVANPKSKKRGKAAMAAGAAGAVTGTAMSVLKDAYASDSGYDDNSGARAAGSSLNVAKRGARDGYRMVNRDFVKSSTLAKKQFVRTSEFEQKKTWEAGERAANKALVRKKLQKARIKREYARAMKKGEAAKSAAHYAKKATEKTTTVARKLIEKALKHKVLILVLGSALVFLLISSTAFTGMGAFMFGGESGVMTGSYQSSGEVIDKADHAWTELESKLRGTVKATPLKYPEYDEYRYDICSYDHDPNELMAYLTASIGQFTAESAVDALVKLFDGVYQVERISSTETRTRTVYNVEVVNGKTMITPVTETYEVKILTTKVTRNDLDTVAKGLMTEDQNKAYEMYKLTRGAFQVFYPPLDGNWYPSVTRRYGLNVNPYTGLEDDFRGIEIKTENGANVYSGLLGEVTEVGFDSNIGNYVVIEDKAQGYALKYGHLGVIHVKTGDNVGPRDLIAKAGATGQTNQYGLYLEYKKDGEYCNPYFYFAAE